jgi:pimeloyl-ACP methyl ester carboxylesterase
MTRIVLAGHSSGAQRVVLYAAERQDARVAGLALASPDLRGFLPPGELAAAQRLVADGQGMEVTPAQPFAPWYRQSAQTVAQKAGILARMLTATAGEPTIAAIHTPVLAFFGSREPGGAATLATIRDAASHAAVTTRIVADADHIYTGHEAAVAALFVEWITALT